MRLLNVHTLDFRDFPRDDDRPLYAIASHRWVDEEITYQEFIASKTSSSIRQTAGYRKVQAFCEFVKQWRRDNEILWIWIDTCCIDKTSNHELSEAINSMFRWYAEARVCIAYLHDVVPSIASPNEVIHSFENSVWFTRGWTLQELLAPSLVVFLDQQWEVLGHKAPSRERAQLAWGSRSIRPFNTQELRLPLNHWISTASGIPPDILADYSQSEQLSISEKRQWMKRRTTTRTEDAAYCLLGICGVYMPLIYGEREFAFERLEEAIENRRRRGVASEPRTTAGTASHTPEPPDPTDTEDEGVVSADEYRVNGNDAYRNGDYTTAVAEYSHAIKIDPRSSRSYQNRAAAHMSLKQYEEALKDCETANSLDPENSKILGRMDRIKRAMRNTAPSDHGDRTFHFSTGGGKGGFGEFSNAEDIFAEFMRGTKGGLNNDDSEAQPSRKHNSTPTRPANEPSRSSRFAYGKQYTDDVEFQTPDGYRTQTREPQFPRSVTRSPSPVKRSRQSTQGFKASEPPPPTARTTSYVYTPSGVEPYEDSRPKRYPSHGRPSLTTNDGLLYGEEPPSRRSGRSPR